MGSALRKDQNGNLSNAGGAKILRPALLRSAGNELIPKWINVSQATPSTPQSLNDVLLRAYSNVDDSYDSAANGYKAILKFAARRDLSGKSLIFGAKHGTGVTWAGQYLFPSLFANPFSFDVYLRFRPIVSDFAIEGLTWDNVVTSPSLSYGTTRLSLFVHAHSNNGGGVLDMSMNAEFSPGRYNLVTLIQAYSSLENAYGILLDAKITGGGAGAPTTSIADIRIQTDVIKPKFLAA